MVNNYFPEIKPRNWSEQRIQVRLIVKKKRGTTLNIFCLFVPMRKANRKFFTLRKGSLKW